MRSAVLVALLCLPACGPSPSLREAVEAEIARCAASLESASHVSETAVRDAQAECHRRLEEIEE
jgi:hypothetical protein